MFATFAGSTPWCEYRSQAASHITYGSLLYFPESGAAPSSSRLAVKSEKSKKLTGAQELWAGGSGSSAGGQKLTDVLHLCIARAGGGSVVSVCAPFSSLLHDARGGFSKTGWKVHTLTREGAQILIRTDKWSGNVCTGSFHLMGMGRCVGKPFWNEFIPNEAVRRIVNARHKPKRVECLEHFTSAKWVLL